MKRILLFSATVLLATVGADGPPAGCGPGMESLKSTDGGSADAGDTPDLSTGGGCCGRVPHLINLASGEDLGILVDVPSLTVFSEKINALIMLGTDLPTTSAFIYFSKADCNGNPYIMQASPPQPRITNIVFVLGPQATYLQPVGNVVPTIHVFSRMKPADTTKVDGIVACENIDMLVTNQLVKYVDTHVKVRPPDDQLKVELR